MTGGPCGELWKRGLVLARWVQVRVDGWVRVPGVAVVNVVL